MSSTYVIAEAGVNHNGSIELALQLADAAKHAGADAVKYQTFRTECNVLPDCAWVDYQKAGSEHESHWEMLKALELSDEEFRRLKQHCDSINIDFLSTPSDRPSVELLTELDLKLIKVASSDVQNIPLLRLVGAMRRPTILSTGLSTLEEVDRAVSELQRFGVVDLILCHCHTAYPTSFEDANLRVMEALRERYGLPVGFSDHTPGTTASIAATAMGACVIEKHLTLDRDMAGPDHVASLCPGEFSELVQAIRDVETALGDGIKRLSSTEQEIRSVYGKGIVTLCEIAEGETFTEANVTVKRPRLAADISQWDDVLGAVAKHAYHKDEGVEL